MLGFRKRLLAGLSLGMMLVSCGGRGKHETLRPDRTSNDAPGGKAPDSASLEAGSPVDTDAGAGGEVEQALVPGVAYEIVNRNSRKCLEVGGGSSADGAGVNQWQCLGTAHQRWELESDPGGGYRIMNLDSGKCLDVAAFSEADGGVIHQWTCTGETNQAWWIESAGSGYFTIRSVFSEKDMEIGGFGAANGATANQWTYLEGPNQEWIIRPAGAGADDSTLQVDFSRDQGPADHRYSGFLYSWWNGRTPPDWSLTDLLPQYWRVGYWGTWDAQYQNMVDAGVQQIQVIVSDAYRNRGDTVVGGYAHQPNWESRSFADIAEEIAILARDNGWDRLAFDIENEPDVFRANDWVSGPPDWYLNEWVPSVRRIRAVLPSAVIVGPSFYQYNEYTMGRFLARSKVDGVEPNVLSWHFLESSPRDLAANIAAARILMEEVGLDLPVSINEYVQINHCGNVDEPVLYLAQAARGGAESIMHSSWDDMGDGSTGDAPCFDCLLTIPDQGTRAVYHVYKFYSSMRGRMMGVTPADGGSGQGNFDGVASSDPTSRTARVLFAGGSGTLNLQFLNVSDSAAYLGSRVQAEVSSVATGDGRSVVDAPTLLTQGVHNVVDNRLSVTLEGLGTDQAYLVTLTPASE